jgi:hypothetical protein
MDRIEDRELRHQVCAFNTARPSEANRYVSLENIPCVLVLCEKGRMGDTFLCSLAEFDLRLRYGGSGVHRSALEQDLGRVCGYFGPGDASRLPRVFLRASTAPQQAGSHACQGRAAVVQSRCARARRFRPSCARTRRYRARAKKTWWGK